MSTDQNRGTDNPTTPNKPISRFAATPRSVIVNAPASVSVSQTDKADALAKYRYSPESGEAIAAWRTRIRETITPREALEREVKTSKGMRKLKTMVTDDLKKIRAHYGMLTDKRGLLPEEVLTDVCAEVILDYYSPEPD